MPCCWMLRVAQQLPPGCCMQRLPHHVHACHGAVQPAGTAMHAHAHAQGNSEACRQMHDVLARQASGVLPGARGLAASAEHFARGRDMQAFAHAILGAVHHEGAGGDLDLFAARAVLQVGSMCCMHLPSKLLRPIACGRGGGTPAADAC